MASKLTEGARQIFFCIVMMYEDRCRLCACMCVYMEYVSVCEHCLMHVLVYSLQYYAYYSVRDMHNLSPLKSSTCRIKRLKIFLLILLFLLLASGW